MAFRLSPFGFRCDQAQEGVSRRLDQDAHHRVGFFLLENRKIGYLLALAAVLFVIALLTAPCKATPVGFDPGF